MRVGTHIFKDAEIAKKKTTRGNIDYLEECMEQNAEVALEDMKFEVVYRPESTSDEVLTHEQLARDMEGWNTLLNVITDKNVNRDLEDSDHIVRLVQEALAGAFEEFQKTLLCNCRFNATDE